MVCERDALSTETVKVWAIQLQPKWQDKASQVKKLSTRTESTRANLTHHKHRQQWEKKLQNVLR